MRFRRRVLRHSVDVPISQLLSPSFDNEMHYNAITKRYQLGTHRCNFSLPSVLPASFNSSLGPRRPLLGRRNILLGCCLLWVSSGVLGGSTGRVFVGRLALQLEATPDPRALELVGHAQSVRNGVGRSLDAEVMTRTSDNGKSEWRALQNAAMYAFRTSISIQQQEEE